MASDVTAVISFHTTAHNGFYTFLCLISHLMGGKNTSYTKEIQCSLIFLLRRLKMTLKKHDNLVLLFTVQYITLFKGLDSKMVWKESV